MNRAQWTPTPVELADLELLSSGVIDSSRGFRVAVPTAISAAVAATDTLELIDPEGVPLARLTVESRLAAGATVTLAGPVEPLAHTEFGPFRRYHRTPAEVRNENPEAFAVPVTAILSTSDVDAVRAHAAETGRTPLLLALTGPGSPQDLSAPGLVRATLAAARDIPDAVVVAVAAAAGQHRSAEVAAAYADETFSVDGEGEPSAAVARIRDQDRPPLDRRGLVVFFTGLSGSGKSTLARALHDVLLERGDRTVTSLDGDVVRHHLSKGLGFSRADRETNIARIGWVAAEISRHGGVAICSPIAPFDATRKLVRGMVEAAGGGFVLVHVATPLEECERRDRKGLYAKARAGRIPEFTGISSPYEKPADARVSVDTTGRSIDDALAAVLDVLYLDGRLSRSPAALAPEG
ncbi:MAG: adenylyl-sulfate kinase [Nocardioidaceae bacterium]|nr:adenylyl-sulfate kinase [Nocardioidaceae bacterium]